MRHVPFYRAHRARFPQSARNRRSDGTKSVPGHVPGWAVVPGRNRAHAPFSALRAPRSAPRRAPRWSPPEHAWHRSAAPRRSARARQLQPPARRAAERDTGPQEHSPGTALDGALRTLTSAPRHGPSALPGSPLPHRQGAYVITAMTYTAPASPHHAKRTPRHAKCTPRARADARCATLSTRALDAGAFGPMTLGDISARLSSYTLADALTTLARPPPNAR